MGGGSLVGAIDAIARETTLFAAVWFLIGGLDDLLIDVIYIARRCRLAMMPAARKPRAFDITDVPAGRMVIFVPAWDESAVIGEMLYAALTRFDHPDYAIYVGAYPNDPDTIAAISQVAAEDDRIRLIVGSKPGPTTKADCLNQLWRALVRDETKEGFVTRAVALHDAEDLVDPLELKVQAQWLERYAAVQLPVLPLVHPKSRFVSGHYLDEFAEAHGKSLLVRRTLGAGLPLAGVGCAIRRDMLERIAHARGGSPFDASSLTEDYELGLTIATMGGDSVLARVTDRPGGRLVAVRAYFPATLRAAVRQKSRCLTGIALAGWDRTGWSAPAQIGDHWMRMRDRRATLAIPVLAVAYIALFAWAASLVAHWFSKTSPPSLNPFVTALLAANSLLLAWRLAVRAAFVGRSYGWSEAALSLPRVMVGNLIALAAARRALTLYIPMLFGAAPRWDKTDHQFPDRQGQAAA